MAAKDKTGKVPNDGDQKLDCDCWGCNGSGTRCKRCRTVLQVERPRSSRLLGGNGWTLSCRLSSMPWSSPAHDHVLRLMPLRTADAS